MLGAFSAVFIWFSLGFRGFWQDAKDIQPYLDLLIPSLKVTLIDPVPDVRATSAKAFGTLANALPEELLGDLLPYLFEMLRSPGSAVERSGAAHGLSEVLMAKGADRIEVILPDILTNAGNQEAEPEAREGYMHLFCYLPVAMGTTFEPLGGPEAMETIRHRWRGPTSRRCCRCS